MYQGSHSKHSENRYTPDYVAAPSAAARTTGHQAGGRGGKRRMAVLAISLLLMVTIAITGTLAYLSTNTDPARNTFKPSHVTCEVNETFTGSEKSNVTVRNTGDTDAYIRAAIVVNWQNAAGEIYGASPVEGTDYTITLGKGWTKGDDGFYYYNASVAPKDSTTNLIERCSPLGNAPEGYGLNVTILASAIQSKGVNSADTAAVKDAWGVTPGVTPGV